MNVIENLSIPEPNSGCWIWLRAVDRDGYGAFTFPRGARRSRMAKAHRLSYEQYIGPIPSGQSVLHKCDNPSCVNPDHLYCGDAVQNSRDALNRGRLKPTGKTPKLAAHIDDIIASNEPTVALAKKYGVHRHTIQLIRARKTWRNK